MPDISLGHSLVSAFLYDLPKSKLTQIFVTSINTISSFLPTLAAATGFSMSNARGSSENVKKKMYVHTESTDDTAVAIIEE